MPHPFPSPLLPTSACHGSPGELTSDNQLALRVEDPYLGGEGLKYGPHRGCAGVVNSSRWLMKSGVPRQPCGNMSAWLPSCITTFSMATGWVWGPHFLPAPHNAMAPWGLGYLGVASPASSPSRFTEIWFPLHCDPPRGAPTGTCLLARPPPTPKGPEACSVHPSGQPPAESLFPGARGADRPGSSPRSGSWGVMEGNPPRPDKRQMSRRGHYGDTDEKAGKGAPDSGGPGLRCDWQVRLGPPRL